MAQSTRFHGGDEAPNNGIYIETGKNDHHMGIQNPKRIELKKGDKLPENSNDDRVWVLESKHHTVH